MKKLFFLLALLLVFGTPAIANADLCTPEDCIDDCIGGWLRIDMANATSTYGSVLMHGHVRTNMPCKEVFKMTFRYRYYDEQLDEKVVVEKKTKWQRPEITIPLAKKIRVGRFYFDYTLPLPNDIPLGEYTVTMTVEGLNTGAIFKKKAKFIVCDTYPCGF